MGLCVLYYVEYSLYNVKKVGFFYLGWNYTLKEHGKTLQIDKTKYGYKKAVVQLEQPDLCDLINFWESQINDYLKSEGIPPITILYGNKIYPKTLIYNTTDTSIIKIKSVWINDENKPFLQLWLE